MKPNSAPGFKKHPDYRLEARPASVQGVWANGERIAGKNGMLPLDRLPGRFLRGVSA